MQHRKHKTTLITIPIPPSPIAESEYKNESIVDTEESMTTKDCLIYDCHINIVLGAAELLTSLQCHE